MLKKYVLLTLTSLFLTGAVQAATGPNYWDDLRKLVVQCSVQSYQFDAQGHPVSGPLQSVCNDQLRSRGTQAIFRLGGQDFSAELVESPDSDGGDLYNLIIRNRRGEVVAQRQNVPAFGDVLLALAGGSLAP